MSTVSLTPETAGVDVIENPTVTRTVVPAEAAAPEAAAVIPAAAAVIPAAPGESPRPVALAVAGSALAGALHLWAAVNHAEEGTRYIVFFVGAALAQFVLAGLLGHRRPPSVVLAGALGTIGLLALYVASRVTDLPTLGAHQHGAEVPLALQIAAVVTELATVTALSTLASGRWRSWLVNAACACGLGLWALWLFS